MIAGAGEGAIIQQRQAGNSHIDLSFSEISV